MLKMKIGNTQISILPENLHKVQKHLATKFKPRKLTTKRVFPKDPKSLVNTDSYVRNYLLMNSLSYRYENNDIATGYILNTAPTTWPTGEDTFEIVDEVLITQEGE